MDLPQKGTIFISVRIKIKTKSWTLQKAEELGFELIATRGTAKAVQDQVEINIIRKVSQESPNIRDAVLNGKVAMIINTPSGKQSADDGYYIRRMAVELGIPYVTTLAGARAALNAIENVEKGKIGVKSLKEYHKYE